MSQVTLALRIAGEAHAGVSDGNGQAFIGHPLRVAAQVASEGFAERIIAAALLHDVVEDTEIGPLDLQARGVDQGIIEIVLTLTRRATDEYADYITRVCNSSDPAAIVIKLADLDDNTDPRRAFAKSESLAPRYALARTRLNAALQTFRESFS